jgi:hypothetical protein
MKLFVLLPDRTMTEGSFEEWKQMIARKANIIGHFETTLHLVSTYFAGIDLRPFGNCPPILFETAVFAIVGDDYEPLDLSWRYSSWDDAEAGHESAIEQALKMEANPRQAWHA